MIKEFVCPNGRMSVNGVCPIFEGDDGQIKDFNKTTKTFDEKYESIEDIEKDKNKSFFEFDFTKPTESAFESAGNIISNNLNAYNSFVEEKLGIPGNIQNLFKVGAAVATGSFVPFIVPFVAGGALRQQENNRIQNITNQDTQGTITTYNMQNQGSPDPYTGGPTGIQTDMGYTGGFDTSTNNYNDPYSPGDTE